MKVPMTFRQSARTTTSGRTQPSTSSLTSTVRHSIRQWPSVLLRRWSRSRPERPGIITYYPVNVYAYSPSFKPWGTANAVTSTTVGLDWAHWKTPADAAINVGSTGPLDAVNSLPTAAQNSFYDRLIYGSIQAGTGTEEADSRGAGVYFNALATSITSSSDHLTWTETVKPHNFQDGVAVTADDYIFTAMSQLRLDVGWVALGTITTQLGI